MRTSWLINLFVSQLIKYTYIGLRVTSLCHNFIMANISCSGTQQIADPLPPGPAVCGVMCASSVHSHSCQQRAWRFAEGCCQETWCLSWSADRSAVLPDQSATEAASQQCCWSLDRVTILTVTTVDMFQTLTFDTGHSFWSHILSHALVVFAELHSADIRVRSILNSLFAHVQPVCAVVFTALCLTFTDM